MKKFAVLLLTIITAASLSAQDFGFGFGDEAETLSGGINSAVSISGEVSASMVGYLDDLSEGLDHTRLGDIFSGKLNFYAGTSFAEGIINLKLKPTSSPVSIDEAYLRAYLGSFDITAGMRKLVWGKADSFGPLDVINPLDYSQIFTEMADNTSMMGVKIARPLVHASYRFGDFSKIEGVFVPWFEPHTLPAGRWEDSSMSDMLSNPLLASIDVAITQSNLLDTLAYAQAGLRFTTTIGSSDIGLQYYYGRLQQPSVGLDLNLASYPSIWLYVDMLYNPYHQIGVDYAQVLFGFNVRAELAANITEDTKGDNGSIYNPSIAWSFGFDRDVILGVNLNLQINESIRLMNNKTGSKDFSYDSIIAFMMTGELDFDIEGGLPATDTRLTAALSKKFLRDELELRAAFIWGMEDKDFALMPALIWTKDDIRFALSGGFFGGNSDGQLGQYKDNGFLKIGVTYSF